MGVKITKATAVSHPEGWFPFKVTGSKGVMVNERQRIQWELTSRERDENGEAVKLSYFTGTVFSSDTRNKLTPFVAACLGLTVEEVLSDNSDEWDSDVLLGKMISGKVAERDDKPGYFNVVAVRPHVKAEVKARAKGAPKTADSNDPFEDE
jgi:hypothetical protein